MTKLFVHARGSLFDKMMVAASVINANRCEEPNFQAYCIWDDSETPFINLFKQCPDVIDSRQFLDMMTILPYQKNVIGNRGRLADGRRVIDGPISESGLDMVVTTGQSWFNYFQEAVSRTQMGQCLAKLEPMATACYPTGKTAGVYISRDVLNHSPLPAYFAAIDDLLCRHEVERLTAIMPDKDIADKFRNRYQDAISVMRCYDGFDMLRTIDEFLNHCLAIVTGCCDQASRVLCCLARGRVVVPHRVLTKQDGTDCGLRSLDPAWFATAKFNPSA